jgi:hypothetical protein
MNDLRLDTMMKSIDVLGRLAFGGQCIAAMAMIAGPAIFVTAAVLPFFTWGDNRGEALALWLGGWLVAVLVTAAGMGLGFFCWRWSGDWITEWYGYAIGFGIAGAANLVLAYLLTQSPLPIYLSFLSMMAVAFVLGFLIAGRLGGINVLPEQREQRQRELARRR